MDTRLATQTSVFNNLSTTTSETTSTETTTSSYETTGATGTAVAPGTQTVQVQYLLQTPSTNTIQMQNPYTFNIQS